MLAGSIAFFGASTVYGIGDPAGGFVTRFRTWYDAHRPAGVVYNLGIPAENTDYLVQRFTDENHRRNPDVVIFHIGANDAYREGSPSGSRAVPLDRFRKNVEFLVNEGLKRAGVAIITPHPVDDAANPHGSDGEEKDAYYFNDDIWEYTAMLRDLATEQRVPVLDLWSRWEQAGNRLRFLINDGLHVNAQGHADIASELISFLQQHFSSF